MQASSDDSSVIQAVEAWLVEARGLRGSLALPDPTDGPNALRRQIVQARSVLDRVEEIVSRLIQLRARVHDQLLVAQFALEDAEAEALKERKLAFAEYTTRKERYGWIASETVIETGVWRHCQRLYDTVDAALDEAKLMHRGVDAVRRDVDVRLRVIGLERQLER